MSEPARAPLSVVGGGDTQPEGKPLDMADDIYAKWRKEIAAIDWAGVHIRSWRREPIWLPEGSRCKRLVRRLFSFESN